MAVLVRVAGFFFAFILGAGGYLGYPAYQDWQENRAVALAKSSLESGDIRSAVLSLQAALRRRPEHLEARRVAASLLEACGFSPKRCCIAEKSWKPSRIRWSQNWNSRAAQ